jgi:hypothetical protein
MNYSNVLEVLEATIKKNRARDVALARELCADLHINEGAADLDAAPDNDNRSSNVTELEAPRAPSNNVTGRRRRSDRRDVQALKSIRFFESAADTSGAVTVADFHTPSSTPKQPPSNDNRIPVWEHTSDRVKAAMAVRSIAERGGHAFTLNLGPTRIADAVTGSKAFSTYVAGFIRRALERECGQVPDFMFTVEQTKRGKLHLHGAVDATDNHLPAVKRALAHAGGLDWVPARRGETQVSLEPIHDADGWARYIFKDGPQSCRIVCDRVLFISKPLRPKAAITYRRYKNKVEELRSMKADSRRSMPPAQQCHARAATSVSAD